jgi:hypothetical protein
MAAQAAQAQKSIYVWTSSGMLTLDFVNPRVVVLTLESTNGVHSVNIYEKQTIDGVDAFKSIDELYSFIKECIALTANNSDGYIEIQENHEDTRESVDLCVFTITFTHKLPLTDKIISIRYKINLNKGLPDMSGRDLS